MLRRRDSTSPIDAPELASPPPDLKARLGMILQEHGFLSAAGLDAGLVAQRELNLPLGEILTRRGDVPAQALAAALAEQTGYPAIDLARYPADAALSEGHDPQRLLRLGLLPWRRIEGRVWCAVADPQAIDQTLATLPGAAEHLSFGLTDRAAIEDEIARLHGPALGTATRDRCPAAFSARDWAAGAMGPMVWSVLLGLVLAAILAPGPALLALLGWILLMNTATTAMRAYGLLLSFRRPTPEVEGQPGVVALPPPGGLPVVSLLVPLYHETATIRHLIASLEKSTYPKELLDVLLVLETDDIDTPLALAQFRLPPWVRVITAPTDALKTKPRAMNYALEFARGSVVGIYDAEDEPEPAQLQKVVRHLAHAGPEVAAVQGYLDFYNARQNWLARCFTVEYAIWFRVLLRGVQRLGFPLPLGGTTVFFRRETLEKVGAWDAHNVTEDADLGMRLARFGYRVEMVDTTTFEEANCRARPWIRQRARWLKGYAMTWITHMRRPGALWRDLGPRGFFGLQLLLLGGLTAYLSTPLFWVLWAGFFISDLPVFQIGAPWVWTGFFGSMFAGQIVMLAVAFRAVSAKPRRHLLPVVPFLMLYWPLGAIAAYRAVIEIFTRPFYWAKTEHGL